MKPYRTFGKRDAVGVYKKKVKYFTEREFNVCIKVFESAGARGKWEHQRDCDSEAEAIEIAQRMADQDDLAFKRQQRDRLLGDVG